MKKMFTPKASVAAQLQLKINTRRSNERQDILPEQEQRILDEIQACIAYMEGASLEDITEKFGIKPSTFKYKVQKLKAYGMKGLLDQRDTNGSYQDKKITQEIGQRIQELKINNPALSSRDIAEILYNQDKTKVSHTIVNEYLNEVGLSSYTGSPFRDGLSPPSR
jgi:transposase